jgi:hypothetical protein
MDWISRFYDFCSKLMFTLLLQLSLVPEKSVVVLRQDIV